MTKESKAFLLFSDDIRNRSLFDWLEAHTSLMYPLYRYKGIIRLDREMLSFFGTERKTGIDFSLTIFRYEVNQIYLGFDQVFTVLETRNLGFGWKPLRVSFTREKTDYHLYLIINYSLGRTDNEIWMELLRNWLR